MSKRQGSVTRSTPEAEIEAMDMTIRILTLPVLCLVEEIFPGITLNICGDNTSMLCVLKTGRNPSMRHLSRTHRISVAWLHEQHEREHFNVKYVTTDEMAADVFTKSIPAPHKWKNARRLINVFESMDELFESISSAAIPVAQPCLYVAVYAQPIVSAAPSILHRSDSVV